MGNPQVVHLIERLALGGAGRCLLGLAKYSSRSRTIRHACISLLPPDPAALILARECGLEIISGEVEERDRALAAADIIQVHFWNSPQLMQELARPWPNARVAVWCHVSGDRPPQVLTRELVAFSDAIFATNPYTAELPVLRNAMDERLVGTILSGPDTERLASFAPRAHDRFTVAYVGTVDFVKLHPEFVAMHAAAAIPGLRVWVCGRGGAEAVLRRQAAQSACGECFEFLGQQENLAELLAEVDVFGNPLCADSYATAELAMQEAMFVGIPPIVLSNAGPARMVQSGITGCVVRDPGGYAESLLKLFREPELRLQLGRNAAAYARQTWGAERSAAAWNDVYLEMLRRSKRARNHGRVAATSGAEAFISSLGTEAPQFRLSHQTGAADSTTAMAADRMIAASSPLLASATAGGILHYRLQYPRDPFLRFWSGLALQQQGRTALAQVEFKQALACGLDPSRVPSQARRFLEVGPEAVSGSAVREAPARITASGGPLPSWVNTRRGLRGVLQRLREEAGSVAYLGNSVTAQRDGYRVWLHEWFNHWSGQSHRPINAGFGGVGSFGCAFMLSELVLRHRPNLCWIECLTGDLAGQISLRDVGPAVEGIVRQLLRAGCAVGFLHLGRSDRPLLDADPVLSIYEEIADAYGIPSMLVARQLECLIDEGVVSRAALYRDSVHTTAVGSFFIGCQIGTGLVALAHPSAPEGCWTESGEVAELPRSRYRDPFEFTEILPATDAMLDSGSAFQWRQFQILHRYLEVPAGGRVRLQVDEGEVLGLLLVVGPSTGGLWVDRGGVVERYNLRDRWCHHERLHVFPLPDPIPAHTTVVISPAPALPIDTPLEGSGLPEAREGILQLVGILVRRRNLAVTAELAGQSRA